MDGRDLTSSRWTLRFRDAALETGYLKYDESTDLGPTRAVLVAFAIFMVLDPVRRHAVIRDLGQATSAYGLLQVAIGAVCLAVLWGTYRPTVIRYRRELAVGIVVSMNAVVFGLIGLAHPSFVKTLTSAWILLMFVESMLTPRFIAKLCTIGLSLTLMIGWCLRSGHYGGNDLFAMSNMGMLAAALASAMAYGGERMRRKRYIDELTIAAERDRTRSLLVNVLPESVAERMLAVGASEKIVDTRDAVVVLFADIVGFTPFAAEHPASEVLAELDVIFARFDAICAQHRVEKIKTIGDAFMAAAGLPDPHEDAAAAVCETALDMLAAVERLARLGRRPFTLRIGIHLGPVVGGLIGRSRLLYDLWGDTVNVAARLEASGEPGRIHVSKTVYDALRARYDFAARGVVQLRGRGGMETYFLRARGVMPMDQRGDAAA